MDTMGADYDRAVESEDRYLVLHNFEELAAKIQKENDYWEIKYIPFCNLMLTWLYGCFN